MKQHIKVEQFKGLSQSQQINLATKLGFTWGYFAHRINHLIHIVDIGRMIGILKHNGNIEGFYTTTEHSIVTLYNGNGANHFDEDNLCDALFEAVKEVLNEVDR